ncbi:MAG: hypothetical protein XE11_0618 [Methanomicrobiales archaeon 53_19]|uniref:hypothetical protein n=1 Tax=Methanocalculus sp. TaxID=2004547 RepID=UPI000749D4C1|nr:hypothetical protein [Methanocalculus sp.]KUK68750.1 MAG: hypothetical protein XD88_1799 [Methanocalculus sp. 52_23]KUL04366.1 MAG: hypothetical protein XE11_0618 [Methanomicrobiales archaeon 53_19]HIJ07193.1 hypothetical protein [Methanocalculus sp.]
MGTRRQMTIGITINLDNYENIRFDLAGEVESDEDATELIAFLDGVLSGIGRDDEVTRERIDHYRSRVFGSYLRDEPSTEEPAVGIGSCPVPGDESYREEEPDRDLSGVDTPEPQPGSPDYPPLEERESGESSEDELLAQEADLPPAEERPFQEAASPVDPVPEPAAEDTAPAASGASQTPQPFICEACGAEVNKVQHDVSHLFMNKTLCKACMNRS